MSRIEFMKELEYLLQDIPDEEKAEAVAYYRDYLEEAGDVHEAEAIREFGSPERVAAIIRSDLAGVMETGGEFTESGYQDERFKDPNYQMIEHRHLPEVTEGTSNADNKGQKESKNKRLNSEDTIWMRCLKVGLLLLGLAIIAPLILGLGGGAVGIIAGIIGVILAGIILVGAGTLAVSVVSVVMFVIGIGMIVSQAWWSGILMVGVGILLSGMALIGVALSILIYGTFLPYIVRGMVNIISGIFHKGGKKKV